MTIGARARTHETPWLSGRASALAEPRLDSLPHEVPDDVQGLVWIPGAGRPSAFDIRLITAASSAAGAARKSTTGLQGVVRHDSPDQAAARTLTSRRSLGARRLPAG